jgi:hypothetical protein
MQLKVFRLREGKLELVGMREPMPGDGILEGSTPMTEVELHESAVPSGKEIDRALKAGRDRRNSEALAASYRDGHPKATDAEVAAFVQGRYPDPEPDTIDDSLRRLHPDWTDKQIEIFRGR